MKNHCSGYKYTRRVGNLGGVCGVLNDKAATRCTNQTQVLAMVNTGRNRRGTEPYARWCERTAGAIPPPTRSSSNVWKTRLKTTVNFPW